MDGSDRLRHMATECLRLARTATDPAARVSLLTLAQNLFDRANAPSSDRYLDAAVRNFNDEQMSRHD
jgi:hypothetical protein